MQVGEGVRCYEMAKKWYNINIILKNNNMNGKFRKFFKILLIIIGVIAVLIIGFIVVAKIIYTSTSSEIISGDYYSGSAALESTESLGLSSPRAMGGLSYSFSKSKNSADSERSYQDNHVQNIQDNKKIIKNGNLKIYVKDAEESAVQIEALAKAKGGYVSESNIYDSRSGYKSGRITVRIPNQEFESTMHNVKEIAVDVESESIDTQDVTEEYVDNEAQLRNLRAEETQYLRIMEKAYTINDTLQVANKLSDVRMRIERIQGRLKYLDRQVDMSTIRINLEADADVKVFGLKWRPLIVAKQAIRNMLEALSAYIDAMINFIFILPVIILWIVTIGGVLYGLGKGGYFVYRRAKRSKQDFSE